MRQSKQLMIKEDLYELLKHLKSHKIGNRELSNWLWAAVYKGYKCDFDSKRFLVKSCYCRAHADGVDHWQPIVEPNFMPPDYSTDLECAKELLPKGSQFVLKSMDNGLLGGHARVFMTESPVSSFHNIMGEFSSTADDRKTLSMALCIATVDALSKLQNTDHITFGIEDKIYELAKGSN